MTVINRVVALAVLAFAVIPFAAAHSVPAPSKSQSCSSSEFYYSKKDCCLPSGGPQPGKPTPAPTPPNGKSCPPTNWYWHEEQGCCVPKHPLPPTNPQPPQCASGHSWQDTTQCCIPTPSKPSNTPTPKPSNGAGGYGNGAGGYGNGGHGNGGHGNGGYGNGWKRTHTSRSVSACPTGLDACPILGLTSGDYECLDTSAELESCGGCASIDEGQDCTAIKGAWNVGCDQGRCNVYSCFAGFKRSVDGASCIPL